MSHEPNDYTPKQKRRDAEYRKTYAAWLAALSPEERLQIEAAGLGEPLQDENGHGENFLKCDLAESHFASESSHLLDDIEPACDQPGYQAQRMDDERVWDIVRRILGVLLSQKNAKLSLECFALVSGVSFLGDSMSDVARRNCVSRAAVSKRCVQLAAQIGVPPSRSMRPLTARKAYAKARNRKLASYE